MSINTSHILAFADKAINEQVSISNLPQSLKELVLVTEDADVLNAIDDYIQLNEVDFTEEEKIAFEEFKVKVAGILLEIEQSLINEQGKDEGKIEKDDIQVNDFTEDADTINEAEQEIPTSEETETVSEDVLVEQEDVLVEQEDVVEDTIQEEEPINEIKTTEDIAKLDEELKQVEKELIGDLDKDGIVDTYEAYLLERQENLTLAEEERLRKEEEAKNERLKALALKRDELVNKVIVYKNQRDEYHNEAIVLEKELKSINNDISEYESINSISGIKDLIFNPSKISNAMRKAGEHAFAEQGYREYIEEVSERKIEITSKLAELKVSIEQIALQNPIEADMIESHEYAMGIGIESAIKNVKDTYAEKKFEDYEAKAKEDREKVKSLSEKIYFLNTLSYTNDITSEQKTELTQLKVDYNDLTSSIERKENRNKLKQESTEASKGLDIVETGDKYNPFITKKSQLNNLIKFLKEQGKTKEEIKPYQEKLDEYNNFQSASELEHIATNENDLDLLQQKAENLFSEQWKGIVEKYPILNTEHYKNTYKEQFVNFNLSQMNYIQEKGFEKIEQLAQKILIESPTSEDGDIDKYRDEINYLTPSEKEYLGLRINQMYQEQGNQYTKGDKGFFSKAGTLVGKTIDNTLEDIGQLTRGWLEWVGEGFGVNDKHTDTTAEIYSAANMIRSASDSVNKIEADEDNVLLNVVYGLIPMATDIALSSALGFGIGKVLGAGSKALGLTTKVTRTGKTALGVTKLVKASDQLKKVMTYGGDIGRNLYWLGKTGGSSYSENIQAGVDRDVSLATALVVGVISGKLESYTKQVMLGQKGFIGQNLQNKLVTAIQKNAPILSQALSSTITKYGFRIGIELTTETLQQAVQETGNGIAKEISLDDFEFWEEWNNRMGGFFDEIGQLTMQLALMSVLGIKSDFKQHNQFESNRIKNLKLEQGNVFKDISIQDMANKALEQAKKDLDVTTGVDILADEQNAELFQKTYEHLENSLTEQQFVEVQLELEIIAKKGRTEKLSKMLNETGRKSKLEKANNIKIYDTMADLEKDKSINSIDRKKVSEKGNVEGATFADGNKVVIIEKLEGNSTTDFMKQLKIVIEHELTHSSLRSTIKSTIQSEYKLANNGKEMGASELKLEVDRILDEKLSAYYESQVSSSSVKVKKNYETMLKVIKTYTSEVMKTIVSSKDVALIKEWLKVLNIKMDANGKISSLEISEIELNDKYETLLTSKRQEFMDKNQDMSYKEQAENIEKIKNELKILQLGEESSTLIIAKLKELKNKKDKTENEKLVYAKVTSLLGDEIFARYRQDRTGMKNKKEELIVKIKNGLRSVLAKAGIDSKFMNRLFSESTFDNMINSRVQGAKVEIEQAKEEDVIESEKGDVRFSAQTTIEKRNFQLNKNEIHQENNNIKKYNKSIKRNNKLIAKLKVEIEEFKSKEYKNLSAEILGRNVDGYEYSQRSLALGKAFKSVESRKIKVSGLEIDNENLKAQILESKENIENLINPKIEQVGLQFYLASDIKVTEKEVNDNMRKSIVSRDNQKIESVINDNMNNGIQGIRFSIGNKRKEEYRNVIIKKRPDLNADNIINALDEYNDPKAEKIALHWTLKGTIIPSDDMEKVKRALKIASNKKLDPMSFNSPVDILNEYAGKVKGDKVNTDTIKEFKNKEVLEHGIVTYTVDETKEGQQAVRNIINSHWGLNANPWCLTYANLNGELTVGSWRMWNKYTNSEKKIVFVDGKLSAFYADNGYWDRSDSQSDEIIIAQKINGDKLKRKSNYQYNPQTKDLKQIGNKFKGDKNVGEYKEWNTSDNLVIEQNRVVKNRKSVAGRYKFYDESDKTATEVSFDIKDATQYLEQVKIEEGYIVQNSKGELHLLNDEDTLHDVTVYKIENGQIKTVNKWEQNTTNGQCLTFDSEGEISTIGTNKQGLRDGIFMEFSGYSISISNWEFNKKQGYEIKYDKNYNIDQKILWESSQKKEQLYYKNNKIEGKTIYDSRYNEININYNEAQEIISISDGEVGSFSYKNGVISSVTYQNKVYNIKNGKLEEEQYTSDLLDEFYIGSSISDTEKQEFNRNINDLIIKGQSLYKEHSEEINKKEVEQSSEFEDRIPFSLVSTAGVESDPTDTVRYSKEVEEAKKEWEEKGTESRFFKKWFGDSKVVDEDGKPLVVFHGSPTGNFNEFKSDMFFSANKEYAKNYESSSASSRNYNRPVVSPKTYEVYLNIKKPFDTRTDERAMEIFEEFVNDNDTEYYSYAMGLTQKNMVGWLETDNLKGFMEEKGYIDEYDSFIVDEEGMVGYDGEVIDRGESYVVFSPENIKSATDNIGSYGQVPIEGVDVERDIRYSKVSQSEKDEWNYKLKEAKGKYTRRWLKNNGYVIDSVGKIYYNGEYIDAQLYENEKGITFYGGSQLKKSFGNVEKIGYQDLLDLKGSYQQYNAVLAQEFDITNPYTENIKPLTKEEQEQKDIDLQNKKEEAKRLAELKVEQKENQIERNRQGALSLLENLEKNHSTTTSGYANKKGIEIYKATTADISFQGTFIPKNTMYKPDYQYDENGDLKVTGIEFYSDKQDIILYNKDKKSKVSKGPKGFHFTQPQGKVVDENNTIHIAEGFATANLISKSLNNQNVLSYNSAHSLERVVENLKLKFPTATIKVYLDNDGDNSKRENGIMREKGSFTGINGAKNYLTDNQVELNIIDFSEEDKQRFLNNESVSDITDYASYLDLGVDYNIDSYIKLTPQNINEFVSDEYLEKNATLKDSVEEFKTTVVEQDIDIEEEIIEEDDFAGFEEPTIEAPVSNEQEQETLENKKQAEQIVDEEENATISLDIKERFDEEEAKDSYWNTKAVELIDEVNELETDEHKSLYKLLFYNDALSQLRENKNQEPNAVVNLQQEIASFKATLSETVIALENKISIEFYNHTEVVSALLTDVDAIILKKDEKDVRKARKEGHYFNRISKLLSPTESSVETSALSELEQIELQGVSAIQSRSEVGHTTITELDTLMDGYENDVTLALISYKENINTVQSLIQFVNEDGQTKRISFFDYLSKEMENLSNIKVQQNELLETLKEKYTEQDAKDMPTQLNRLIERATKSLESATNDELESNGEVDKTKIKEKIKTQIASLQLIKTEIELVANRALKAGDEDLKNPLARYNTSLKEYNKLNKKETTVKVGEKEITPEADMYDALANGLLEKANTYIEGLLVAKSTGKLISSMDMQLINALNYQLNTDEIRTYMQNNNDFRVKIDGLVEIINEQISKAIDLETLDIQNAKMLTVMREQDSLDAWLGVQIDEDDKLPFRQKLGFNFMTSRWSPQMIAQQFDGLDEVKDGKVQIGPMSKMVNTIMRAEAKIANTQNNLVVSVRNEMDRVAKKYGIKNTGIIPLDKTGNITVTETSDERDGKMMSYVLAGLSKLDLFVSDKTLVNKTGGTVTIVNDRNGLNRITFLDNLLRGRDNLKATEIAFHSYVETGNKSEFLKHINLVLANNQKTIFDLNAKLEEKGFLTKKEQASLSLSNGAIRKFEEFNTEISKFDDSIDIDGVDYSQVDASKTITVPVKYTMKESVNVEELFKKTGEENYLVKYMSDIKLNKNLLANNSKSAKELSEKILQFHLLKIEKEYETEMDKESPNKAELMKIRDKAIKNTMKYHNRLVKKTTSLKGETEYNHALYYLNSAKTNYLISLDMQANTSKEGEVRKLQMEIKFLDEKINELVLENKHDEARELTEKVAKYKKNLKEFNQSEGDVFTRLNNKLFNTDKDFFKVLEQQSVKRVENNMLIPAVVEFQKFLEGIPNADSMPWVIGPLNKWLGTAVLQVKDPTTFLRSGTDILSENAWIPARVEWIGDKLNTIRIMSRLVGNVSWSLFTQPLSMLITANRYGYGRTSMATMAYVTQMFQKNVLQSKILKSMGVDINTDFKPKLLMSKGVHDAMDLRYDVFTAKQHDSVFNLEAEEQPINKVDALQIYDAQSSSTSARQISRTKSQSFNNVISSLSNALESTFDQVSVMAKFKQLESQGVDLSILTDTEKQIIAEKAVATTQSVYNQYNRPLILNNKLLRFIAPHQTYFMTVMNNFAEVIHNDHPNINLFGKGKQWSPKDAVGRNIAKGVKIVSQVNNLALSAMIKAHGGIVMGRLFYNALADAMDWEDKEREKENREFETFAQRYMYSLVDAGFQMTGTKEYVKNGTLPMEFVTKVLGMKKANKFMAELNTGVFEIYGKNSKGAMDSMDRYLSLGLTSEVKTIYGLVGAISEFDSDMSYEDMMKNDKFRTHLAGVLGPVIGAMGFGGGSNVYKFLESYSILLDKGDIYDSYGNYVKTVNNNSSSVQNMMNWGLVSFLGWKKTHLGTDFEYERMQDAYKRSVNEDSKVKKVFMPDLDIVAY